MAITTDTTIDVQIDGITVDTIGLSDTLDNYSIDDIISSGYCSLNHGLWLCGYAYTYQDQKIMTSNIPVTLDSAGFPIECSAGDPQGYNYPDGKYCAIVWLYSTNATFDYAITDINCDNYRMVTEWNAPRYVYYPASPSTDGVLNTYRYGNWTDNEIQYGVWSTTNNNSFQHCYYWSDDLGTDKVEVQYIKPYLAFVNENDVPFLLSFDYGYSYACGMYGDTSAYAYNSANISFDRSENVAYTVAIDSLGNTNLAPPNADTMPFTMNSYGRYGQGWTADGKFAAQIVFGSSSIAGHNGYLSFETYFMLHSKDDIFRFIANTGLKFYTDKLYKPIISGGHVVGYTDDMDEESELDEWDGTANHGASPYPPTPPPGPGYDDDPWNGATFAGTGVGGAGAFAKCYYMTSTELANLRSWMNSINVPEGFDPMQQIIGLSQVPVALSGSGPENVVFVNSSAVYDPGVTTRAVDTGVATQQAMGTPISYYLGSVDIVRRMQERGEPYLDYDCQIELYLPLIGMFSLDTQAVMGRTISAYAVLDPVSGTLAAYAYVTKDGQNLPVAYGSTSIGVDLPISAQQLSVSRAALKQANAQLGASLLSGALTMLAAASSGGKSSGSGAKTATGSSGLSAAGIREAGSDYMKASQVGNVFGDFMQWGRTIRQLSYGNNTAIAGSFGGSTAQWSYPFTPYVKIIRPRFEKPSNYNHSQGVPCVQTKTIGSCTGFIQCIGADVSGISGATDLELQAIQAALSNGIYAGGGQ